MSELKPVLRVQVNKHTKQRYVDQSNDLMQYLTKGTTLYAIPEGYTIVPTDPTDNILDAIFECLNRTGSTEEVYKAMLEASKG